MPIDPNNPPQSFDDLEARLRAEDGETSDDILPPKTDAAQDDARSEDKPKEAPKTEKKPAPTEPKDTDPKAKETPAPKDAKAKEAERQDRSWKKLAEEREKDRLEREKIAQEKEAIARERAEIQRLKDEAGKQPPPKTEPKQPELTAESLTHLAQNKRAEATKLRNAGDFAKAEAAEKLAEEAEDYAKTLAQQPAPQAEPKATAPNSGDPKPGTPEFLAAQTQIVDEIVQHYPDLKNPDSALSKATKRALDVIPHFQRTPDGVRWAINVGDIMVRHDTAIASEAQLKTKVQTLEKQLAEAQARIAGAPPGGGAPNPPTPPNLESMTSEERWEWLAKKAGG